MDHLGKNMQNMLKKIEDIDNKEKQIQQAEEKKIQKFHENELQKLYDLEKKVEDEKYNLDRTINTKIDQVYINTYFAEHGVNFDIDPNKLSNGIDIASFGNGAANDTVATQTVRKYFNHSYNNGQSNSLNYSHTNKLVHSFINNDAKAPVFHRCFIIQTEMEKHIKYKSQLRLSCRLQDNVDSNRTYNLHIKSNK